MASRRCGRHHLGLQLPGRGLVLERGPGARVRRCHRLETLGKDTADGPRGPCPVPTRRRSVRCGGARASGHAADRRQRRRRVPRRRRARAGPFGHGFDPHGPCGRREAGPTLRQADPRARRQQCLDRDPLGRPRSDAAGRRVRGHGNGRAALHHAAPPHRARGRLRGAGAEARGRRAHDLGRQPGRGRCPRGSAHRWRRL